MAVNLVSSSPPTVRFGLDHADGIQSVALVQELRRPRLGPELTLTKEMWHADLEVSGVLRLEYLYRVTDGDGGAGMITDPDNPLLAPGAFGEKSEYRLPGYQPPVWLGHPMRGRVRSIGKPVDGSVTVSVWSPPRIRMTTALPVLLVHDGTEYARYSHLLDFCWWVISEVGVRPFRVALLDPEERTRQYSCDPTYMRHLEVVVLPGVTTQFRTTSVLGMGASLGGLAMMHLHVQGAGLDGLFLQSGAFFRPDLDMVERGLGNFGRITDFVDDLLSDELTVPPGPIAMTCGTMEENLANNRLLRDHLTKQDREVALTEQPDVHNWTAWRDSLDIVLLPLLRRVWG